MTMSDEITTETRVAPVAEPRLLTEHVNVLMTEETRAFLLGSKIADEARSEGSVARTLLDAAVYVYRRGHAAEYDRRVALGRGELARRGSAGA